MVVLEIYLQRACIELDDCNTRVAELEARVSELGKSLVKFVRNKRVEKRVNWCYGISMLCLKSGCQRVFRIMKRWHNAL